MRLILLILCLSLCGCYYAGGNGYEYLSVGNARPLPSPPPQNRPAPPPGIKPWERPNPAFWPQQPPKPLIARDTDVSKRVPPNKVYEYHWNSERFKRDNSGRIEYRQ